MIAEIIAVGTEVTIGSITNSNAVYLARRLSELGVEVCYHTAVDDDQNRLTSVFKTAVDRSELIILIGGLGPTEDDLTKETIAKVIDRPLESDYEMEEKIKHIFSYSNREMTVNNLKQATKPQGADFIPNDYGTAPGIFIRHEGKIIVLLPGPPRELKPMFDQYVTELLKGDFHIVIKSVNTIGVGESQLEDTLRKIDLNYQGFTVNTYASLGSVEIKIIGKGMDENYLNKSLEFIIEKLKAELGDYIYGFDNISIEEAVLEKLNEKNYKIAVAESCTGGEIARRITRVAGASQAFCLGVVAYSNNSKVNELYVSEDSLKNYGAVSSEIAYEMAKGILSKGGYDIAVSTTGFAGPTAGEGKKAGLVYICIMDRDRHLTLERVFTGDRNTVQERATNLALSELYKFLNYTLTE